MLSAIACPSTLPLRVNLMMNDKASHEKPPSYEENISDVILSSTLLGQEKSVFILHEGHKYRLSITKLRKLILTK